MNVSLARAWLPWGLLIPLFLALAGSAWAQTPVQTTPGDETQELPSVTVGPPPASKRPSVVKAPADAAGAASKAAQPPKTLRLRLDPKTGKALNDAQLRERARRPVQAPRSLRPQGSPRWQQPEAAAAAATVSGSTSDSEKKPETNVDDTSGIQVTALGQAKVSAIGLLNKVEGGFGSAMWAGTPKALVMQLLPRLPMYTTSPTMQSLRRRLLISTALPPMDDGGDQAGGDGRALVALRIARLAATGDSDAVAQLLKFAPLSMENQIFARVRVEAELLAGNVREACRITRNRLGADTSQDAGGAGHGAAVAWQKIMAFCLALDGQTAQAELYEQLLYENGVEDEAFFTLLTGLISGEAEPLEHIARAEPLHLAMLRAARRAIPADAVKQASPVVLRAIASSPNATLPMRLEAAERAEAMATLETDVLARVYASVPFSAEQNADALALAKQEPGPSASAILYQVAQIDAQVESRAQALAAAWRNGQRSGRYMTSVRINLAMTRAIKADARLAWFAAAAGRALLAAGDPLAARDWLMAVLEPARAGQADAAAAMLSLTPLMYIADADRDDPALAPVMAKVLSGWWQGEVANGGVDRYQRAFRLYGLLTALGRDLSASLWLPMFEAPSRDIPQASPALLMGLERAAAAGRRGEAVLLSLLLLGDRGPGLSDTMTLGRVVSALRQVGLVEDARAMALEGLLGAGF